MQRRERGGQDARIGRIREVTPQLKVRIACDVALNTNEPFKRSREGLPLQDETPC